MKKTFIILIFLTFKHFFLCLDCSDYNIEPESKIDCHQRELSGVYSNSNAYCCYIKGLTYGSPEPIYTCFPFFKSEIDDNMYKNAEKFFIETYSCKEIYDFDCSYKFIKYTFSLLYIFFLLF